MAVELNHTIVHAHDAVASARFYAEVFGLADPVPFGPFQTVATANRVSLDFIDAGDYDFVPQHYAFLVSDDEFDEIFDRVTGRGLEYWADPARTRPGEISTWKGRGCYFLDPSDHFLEIITEPYVD